MTLKIAALALLALLVCHPAASCGTSRSGRSVLTISIR